jgi:hypothetical protein
MKVRADEQVRHLLFFYYLLSSGGAVVSDTVPMIYRDSEQVEGTV